MTNNMNTSLSTEEMTDEIPLEPATPRTNTNQEDNDDEVDALLDELKEPTEQDVAVERLVESTNNLKSAILSVSSDIDSKLEISQKARSVDENLGVSKTASSAAFAVGSFLSKLQLREKAAGVVNSDAVRSISSTVNTTLEKTGVKDAVASGTNKVKQIDEQHSISTKTAQGIAGGVDWVTKNLNHVAGKTKSQDES